MAKSEPEKTARQRDTALWALSRAVESAEAMTGADHSDYLAEIARRRAEAQAEDES